MPILLILFIAVPLVEIYFLIEVGSELGAGFTVFMVVLTAIIGAALVRYQGLTTLARAQTEMLQSRMPAVEVMEGAALLLAGAMLMVPGFVTDALGFLLLVPPLRQWMIRRFLAKRVVPANPYADPARPNDEGPRIIDIDPDKRD